MLTKLEKHDDQPVLVLEQDMLTYLNIDFDTPLNVEAEGDFLIIHPVRNTDRQKQFQEALTKINRKYGRMLQRLAD